MSDFIAFLTREVPWLLPTLGWIGGIILVGLILAFPAYYVLWPFFQRARVQLGTSVANLIGKVKMIATQREEKLDSAADEFLNDGGLLRLKVEAAGNWIGLMNGLSRTLRQLREPLNGTVSSLRALTRGVTDLEKRIHKCEPLKLYELPELSAPHEFGESVAKVRVAWMKFGLASIVLFGLMLVNTGMLSEILLDLGVVPATMMFLGVQLAAVFAFILTLVEAGLGVAHGATRSEDEEKITVFPFVITFFAVLVACVEGFFYSRVAPTGSFALPFVTYEMEQSSLFFLWGFVLVMTLFSLGLIAFDAGVVIVRGTPSRTISREMTRLRKKHDEYSNALKRSEERLVAAKTVAKGIDKVVQGPTENAESVHEELKRVSDRINSLAKVVPEWVKDAERPLTRSEVHETAQRGGLWLLLSMIGLFVQTVAGLFAFESFYPELPSLFIHVLAIGHAFAFLAAGGLLGAGETVVRGKDSESRVVVSPRFSRFLAYALGGALLVANTVIFFVNALPSELGTLWALCLLVGLFVTAAGYQLIPLINVVRLWLWRIWNAVIIVFQMIWIGIVRFSQFLVVLMENLSYLLALPLLKLFHRKREAVEEENERNFMIPSRSSSTEKRPGGRSS